MALPIQILSWSECRGGVDSSVSAWLLKQQGYQVIGLFMKNWEEPDENGQCTAEADFEDVVKVCSQLDIPYYSVEFIQEYRESVFARFLEEYKRGYTPNPDVLCNREIKFGVFLKYARELGASLLATGHYCQTDGKRLLKGLDQGKDQSYFVHAIDGRTLATTLFPIGGMQKSQVRKIALEAGLSTHAKKDSTGICFIGERKFKQFLSQYVQGKSGLIRLLETGETVGEHSGIAYYTLGQRKGLGLGGQGDPWFVVKKDSTTNTLWVSRGDDHPALYSNWLRGVELSWIQGEMPQSVVAGKPLQAKIRYRQTEQACRVELQNGPHGQEVVVHFDDPQRAATPGQYVVFYDEDECLGGGVIDQVGPSLWDQGVVASGNYVTRTS